MPSRWSPTIGGRQRRPSRRSSSIWDDGGNGQVTSRSIEEFLRSGLAAKDAGVGRKEGDVAAGLAQAATRVEAEYAVPFLGHATLEPQNCTAHVTRDKVEIWAPTQNGEATLAAAAQAAGVPARNVVVHKCMLGGGFGRRGAMQDFVSLAVRIARQVEQPVKVIWTREEDTRHDFYRPVAMARMAAGLDATGLPLAWHVRMTGQSIMAMMRPLPGGLDKHFQEGFLDDMPYDVPNYLADYAMRMTHVPVGFWRCVNHTQNCFFKESFIDELAHAAGQDPYHYRRKMLRQHPRAARFVGVLDAAAAGAGWDTPPPPGVHRGIALNEVNGTYNAAVIEVSVGGARAARPSRGQRHRLRARGQPDDRRDAGRKRHRLCADRRALRRNHHQGRPRGAIELPRLPDAAAGADAQGRNRHRAERRLLGRRRRAPGCGGRAGAV